MTDPTTDDLSATEIALKTEARRAAARALRAACPRSAHGHWKVRPKGRDVVAMLEKSSAGRLADLVPIRYGRMLKSPFAFLRGAASIMAYDLSETPTSGIRTQIGGDCHLMNFGEFGTPERNIIFDINDFDETLPGPWEWDIKRLCASIVLAGRRAFLPRQDGRIRGHESTAMLVQPHRRRPAGKAQFHGAGQPPPGRRGDAGAQPDRRGAAGQDHRAGRRPAPHQGYAAAAVPSAALARLRETDAHRVPALPPDGAGRPPPSARPLQVGGRGVEGGRRRQRRHALRGGAADERRARAAVPAI